MLRRAKEFKDYKLRALDGDLGKAREFYFDDESWSVRYLVADTAGWLSGRRVLLSPPSLGPVNQLDGVLPVNLTKKKIEESPALGTHEPVSRQFEMQYYGYYGWAPYWGDPFMVGTAATPAAGAANWPVASAPERKEGDPHLRSTEEVSGYRVHATNGEIGHVEDFLVDDEAWVIRYLIIDTRNWWPGKHVLMAPRWIEKVSWSEARVFVSPRRELIEKAPGYKDGDLSRDYEAELHRHYQREGYWEEKAAPQKHG